MSATIGALLAGPSGARIARGEAAILLAHVLGTTRVALATYPERAVSDDDAARFAAFIDRRVQGEPIAYLVGSREFYGLDLAITPAVLVPRAETELLVDLAREWIGASAARVLDLGTGSGAIAIAIAHECPAASVSAVDVSDDALAVARANADRHRVSVRFVRSDWYAALGEARFDLIVANPPYIAAGDVHLAQGDPRFEPSLALTPGGDGLDAIRRIVAGAGAHLVAGGRLAIEHGFDQPQAVRALFAANGLVEVRTHLDLQGHGRVTAGHRPS